MAVSRAEMQIRKPRHDVRSAHQVAAWVHLGDERESQLHEATLVDVSRHGCRLFAGCELEPNRSVQIVIDLPHQEKQTVAAAEVRWRLDGNHQVHEYGLEFSPLLDWEFLGELFLSGTLNI